MRERYLWIVVVVCLSGYIASTHLIQHRLNPVEHKVWKKLCGLYFMPDCVDDKHWKNPCSSPYVYCKYHNFKSVIYRLRLLGSGTYNPISKQLLKFRHLESLEAIKVFRGSIPSWIHQLSPQIKSIIFNGNRLEGPIPATLAKMKSLEVFEAFEQCAYRKPLPNNPHDGGRPCRRMFRVKWDKYDETSAFDWSCGGLSGRIPDSIQTMTQLRRFWVDENRLSGPLPAWFAKMPNLEQLDLFGNDFQGSIPKEWKEKGSFPKLELLQIGGTRIKATARSLAGILRHAKRLEEIHLRDISISPSLQAFVQLYSGIGYTQISHPLHIQKK